MAILPPFKNSIYFFTKFYFQCEARFSKVNLLNTLFILVFLTCGLRRIYFYESKQIILYFFFSSTQKTPKKKKIPKCKCCDNQIDDTCHMIYGKKGRAQNLEGLIFDCIGRKVTEAGGSHQVICDDCFERLKQIQKFKQECASKHTENNVSESEEEEEDDEEDEDVQIQEDEEVLKQLDKIIAETTEQPIIVDTPPKDVKIVENPCEDDEVTFVNETKLENDPAVKKHVTFGKTLTPSSLKLISTSGLKLTKIDPKLFNSKFKIDPKKLKPISPEVLSQLGNFNKFRKGILKTPEPTETVKEIEEEIETPAPAPKKLKLDFHEITFDENSTIEEKMPEPLIELKGEIPDNFEILSKIDENEKNQFKPTFKSESPVEFDNSELLTEMIPQPMEEENDENPKSVVDFEENLSFTKIDKKNDINKLEVMTEEELVKILGDETEDDAEFYNSKLLNSTNEPAPVIDSDSDSSSNQLMTNTLNNNSGYVEVVEPFDYNETIEFTSMQHNDDNTGQFQEGFACRVSFFFIVNRLVRR